MVDKVTISFVCASPDCQHNGSVQNTLEFEDPRDGDEFAFRFESDIQYEDVAFSCECGTKFTLQFEGGGW